MSNEKVPSRRILLVEDNEDAAEMMSILLELEGHKVRVARDGRDAVEMVRADRPDVVILDIGLPDMDGCEVACRLRSERELEGLLLVALTGYGLDLNRKRAMEAGFDHYLVKPVDPAQLRAILVGTR